MRRSAGILVYKIEDNRLKVLLCHFGGPYWTGIDQGGWSLSKGEVGDDEKVVEAARREFKEETNLDLNSNLYFLGSRKVSRKKLAIMFYTNSSFDLSNCKSNFFELEYPRGSGKVQTFPEMDRYEWMDIDKAKEMIIPNQYYFLKKLEEKLSEKSR